MIDAERLMRLRGLAKRDVSRRARLLHHVYTWLRILGESTFTLPDEDKSGRHAKLEILFQTTREGSSTTAEEDSQLDDFLRIETWGTDSEPDVETPKDQATGLRDIHLADLRQWPQTLYMDIYGIPELWLSLVSQTTRVANVMDLLEQDKTIEPPRAFTDSLQKKTNRLEHMICSLSAQYSVKEDSSAVRDHIHTNKPSEANRAMLRALGSALVIFFYRRIRKVHPWILQSHVEDVSAALKEFGLAQSSRDCTTSGSPWPAFIAGCEAMSSLSRDWFMTWMQKGESCSTYPGFSSSQQVMQDVWQHRDAADRLPERSTEPNLPRKKGDVYSWIDALRTRNIWIMLY